MRSCPAYARRFWWTKKGSRLAPCVPAAKAREAYCMNNAWAIGNAGPAYEPQLQGILRGPRHARVASPVGAPNELPPEKRVAAAAFLRKKIARNGSRSIRSALFVGKNVGA